MEVSLFKSPASHCLHLSKSFPRVNFVRTANKLTHHQLHYKLLIIEAPIQWTNKHMCTVHSIPAAFRV